MNGLPSTVKQFVTGGESMPTGQGDLEYLSYRLNELRRIMKLIPPEQSKPWGMFRLFRRQFDELTFSYILAYLLNPMKPHGLGITFLRSFLSLIEMEEPPELSTTGVETEVACRNRRADIVLHGLDWYILIENKVYAAEGDGQTVELEQFFTSDRRFKDKSPHFIYITPKGLPADNPSFKPLSYVKIVKMIRGFTLSDLVDIPTKTFLLLSELAEHIEENICMTRTDLAKVSDLGKLYLAYADEVDRVSKAIESDLENVWTDWQSIIENVLGSGWTFPKLRGSYRQVYKKEWKCDGFYVHFETSISKRNLAKRIVPFRLEVEKQNDGSSAPPEVMKWFDEDVSFKAMVEAIGSEYRPEYLEKALVVRDYPLSEDLADLGAVLVRAYEEHQVLVEKVDDILQRHKA